MLSKLFTTEDNFNIHKSLGFLTLMNFFIQSINFIFFGNMFYIEYLIGIHLMLHLTSFIFNVLPSRPKNGTRMNMFIWEELRMHSMIFAYRACFCIIYPELAKYIIFVTMILADMVTHFVGDKNFTTVRGQHDKNSSSFLKKIYGSFFSISQMGATAICSGCFQPEFSSFLAFQTLIPIQTSAFGLTLLRKNIISKTFWQVVYSIELSLVYFWWYIIYGNLYIIPMSVIPYIFRKFNFSKYFIWIVFVLIDENKTFLKNSFFS